MSHFPATRQVPTLRAPASLSPLLHTHKISDPDEETGVSNGAREKGDHLIWTRVRE
jgi:hypothetical protein